MAALLLRGGASGASPAVFHSGFEGGARPVTALQPLALAALLCATHTVAAQTAAAPVTPATPAAPVAQTAPVAPAQPAGQAAADAVLKEMVVSASRDAQDPDALPMTMDVITAQQMEAQQMSDIRELADKLPNVTVPRSPARFTLAGASTGRDQNSGFNIRGLAGNRVLMLVDGVRLPQNYGFSANNFGRDYLDLGLVQRVEVIRGAVPALYGSDGMGGLVNFITVLPGDVLKDGQNLGGRVSAGYDGSDRGTRLGAVVAGRANEAWSWLLAANVGRAHALGNRGDVGGTGVARTDPNPERDKSHALLGRLVYAPSAVQNHVFTLENVSKRADYQLLSAQSATVAQSGSFTTMDRWRASWQGVWRHLASPALDELRLMAAYQNADSRQWVDETRVNLPYRVRDVTYDEGSLQLHAQADKTLRWGSAASGKISYGLDYLRGKVNNEQNGVTPAAGERFPLKRFPDTVETSGAAFAQAELNFGRWSITPGLRAEHYSIRPRQAGFVPEVANNAGSAVTPKLAALLQATDAWALYGSWAAGFRAPNAGQINAYFANPQFYYSNIPNPNLKPEHSSHFELGLRGRMERLKVDAAVFTGRYRDFIEDQHLVSGQPGNRADPGVYQSVNLNRVRISGWEVKADYDWGRFAGGNWATHLAYGYAKGQETTTHTPLDSISPGQLVLGVRYDTQAVGVQLSASHWARKNAHDAAADAWLSPAATVLDLSAQWRLRKDWRLNAGIYNLTHQKYWRWADVRGLTGSPAYIDAYTQPGRNVRVNLVADF